MRHSQVVPTVRAVLMLLIVALVSVVPGPRPPLADQGPVIRFVTPPTGGPDPNGPNPKPHGPQCQPKLGDPDPLGCET